MSVLDEQAASSAPWTDWVGVGLVLAVAGSFLLANSILFRRPREQIEEYFGKPTRRLHSTREYIFHRAQVQLGFLLLLSGFGLQILGRYRQGQAGTPEFPVVWVGLCAGIAVALEIAALWYSHQRFRRSLREFLRENPVEFETDARSAREVGELFGIESAPEDTVQSYAARIRARLGLPSPVRTQDTRRRTVVPESTSVAVDDD